MLCNYCKKEKSIQSFIRRDKIHKMCNTCSEKRYNSIKKYRSSNKGRKSHERYIKSESKAKSNYLYLWKNNKLNYPVYKYKNEWKALPGFENNEVLTQFNETKIWVN